MKTFAAYIAILLCCVCTSIFSTGSASLIDEDELKLTGQNRRSQFLLASSHWDAATREAQSILKSIMGIDNLKASSTQGAEFIEIQSEVTVPILNVEAPDPLIEQPQNVVEIGTDVTVPIVDAFNFSNPIMAEAGIVEVSNVEAINVKEREAIGGEITVPIIDAPKPTEQSYRNQGVTINGDARLTEIDSILKPRKAILKEFDDKDVQWNTMIPVITPLSLKEMVDTPTSQEDLIPYTPSPSILGEGVGLTAKPIDQNTVMMDNTATGITPQFLKSSLKNKEPAPANVVVINALPVEHKVNQSVWSILVLLLLII